MSDETPKPIDRRKFHTVVGVTGAGAAALSGCSTERVEKLVPYLVQSEDQIPGIPTYYASTCTECSAGCGLHVKTREARAIKLEGNPAHPVNAGTLCSRGQSALQGLYNPDRLAGPMQKNGAAWKSISWDDAIALLASKLGAAGGKVAVLSGGGRGTFDDLLGDWTRALGGQVVHYQPFDHEPLRLAHQKVFGVDQLPFHDLAKAKHIVSFGADFLETWLAPTEQQRGFAESHGFADGTAARHVYIGPRMSLTGMNADEWQAVTPGSEAVLALGMANVILSERSGAPADANALRATLAPYTPEKAGQAAGIQPAVVQRLAREFASAKPSLAVAGGVNGQHREALELCAAVDLLNYVAGNVGQTVVFGADLQHGDGYAAVEALFGRMDQGQVAVALVHEANPLYALPRAGNFAARFAKVPFKVSTSLWLDETADACDLILPNLHALERWDDLRPRAGVTGLLQPAMEPVFAGRHTGDVLLQVAKKLGGALGRFNAPDFKSHLEQAWAQLARKHGQADAVAFWREALERGGLYEPRPTTSVRLAPGARTVSAKGATLDGDGAYVLLPAAGSMLYDGRGANRPWLLEMSDPVTKITWNSWVEVHPDTAQALDVREGELLRLTTPHGSIDAAVYVYPGIIPGAMSVPLGWGHTQFGRYATGRGANALDLIDARDGNGYLPYVSTRVSATKTGGYRQLAKTEGSNRQLGRGIADAMPLAAAKQGLTLKEAYAAAGHPEKEHNTKSEVQAIAGFRESVLEKQKHGGYAEAHPKWGMVVDLDKCTGCSACVTACYAENNIPIVGEDDILRGREMTWMRIERYYEGGTDGEPLETRFVPMLCQQCDNAPCEPVCPVYASYHTVDGLNGQVYNRCVGTRYCSNNCPFKVRYFNWYAYAKRAFPEPLNLQLNPDVTVRARGVMEKCTFCVQRIRGAQHEALMQGRALKDGDIVTACQQACPSGAIVFGNVKDPDSKVVHAAAASSRGYHVFDELNVRSSITYLAKVTRPVEA
jgi:molybdopterin-containing oxidoreductase family iron-sulfur binding subunit